MLDKAIVKRLKKIVGEKSVLDTPEDLAVYGYDATFEDSPPDVVVLPTTTKQVSEIIVLALEEKIPVIPRGMGSGLAAASERQHSPDRLPPEPPVLLLPHPLVWWVGLVPSLVGWHTQMRAPETGPEAHLRCR